MPIFFEFLVGGRGRTSTGDRDEEALLIHEVRRVFLEVTAKATTDQISVVSFFRGALAGDESCLQ